MADFYVSRVAVAFTPDGGDDEVELLAAGDVLAVMPSSTYTENVECIPLLGRVYAGLRATGGLTREYEFTVAVPGASVAEVLLRLRGLEGLNERPCGVVRFEDGFHMGVPVVCRRYVGSVALCGSMPLAAEDVPPLMIRRYGVSAGAWGLLGVKLVLAAPLD